MENGRLPQSFGYAKVPQFQKFGRGHENVLGLEVAVEDLVLVQVGQSKTDLDEKVPDRLLFEVFLGFHLPLNELLQVAGVGVLHDDGEHGHPRVRLGYEAVLVADNVDVAALLDDLNLVEGFVVVLRENETVNLAQRKMDAPLTFCEIPGVILSSLTT